MLYEHTPTYDASTYCTVYNVHDAIYTVYSSCILARNTFTNFAAVAAAAVAAMCTPCLGIQYLCSGNYYLYLFCNNVFQQLCNVVVYRLIAFDEIDV